MNKIQEQIETAEQSDAYFITITRKEGDKLYHFQTHSFGFYYKDLLPSLEAIRKLLEKEYTGMKYV